nr:MAG TPA: hypothetical protein [Caudoviricetes sp.]
MRCLNRPKKLESVTELMISIKLNGHLQMN